MKKLVLTTAAIAMLGSGIMAQNNGLGSSSPKPKGSAVGTIKLNGTKCATQTPSKQWDEWFNKNVSEYKPSLAPGKASAAT